MAPGCTVASELRRKTYLVLDSRIAWLLAFEKPTFSAFAIKFTWGNSLRTISTDPSVLALSTTQTSNVIAPGRSEYGDVRQALRSAQAFQFTTMTAMSFINFV